MSIWLVFTQRDHSKISTKLSRSRISSEVEEVDQPQATRGLEVQADPSRSHLPIVEAMGRLAADDSPLSSRVASGSGES